ncbi:surfeit locus protein 2-like [Mizuhopecten yessoensis]|uniref:surfeit locus protein 2-like n=1 Tax=Mizuhopecten yessoensis TaxID=6573 RepID=UPI000B45A00B|nr:surfeit locus protein 2-like [Mizuhopecten yessoensis]
MAAKGELHVDLLSKDLQSILQKYPTFSLQKGREKIQCELSGHEMPCNSETINSYISGKKFQRLLAQNTFDYEKYKQHIIPSTKKGRAHQLFCLLTLRHMNNLPHHIKHHVEGRRFLKAHRRWEECQKTGQVFKPLSGKRKQAEHDTSHPYEAESDDQESDVDSLSDLYPAADFEEDDSEEDMDGADSAEVEDTKHLKKNGKVSTEDESDSDREFENLQKSGVTSAALDTVAKTSKRKHKKEKTPTKQIKKKK